MNKIFLVLSLFVVSACSHIHVQQEEPTNIQTEAHDTIFTIAHLGGRQYAEVMRDSHPRGFGAVIFTNTFGDAYHAIDLLLATGKVPLLEYNLLWSDTHSFSRSNFQFIVNEAKKYAELARKYPNVACIFSGATEHRFNKQDATDLANAVLAVIPDWCFYSNNPWVGNGSFINPTNRIWNEVHGWNANPPNIGGDYICSLDGDDVFDINVTYYKNTCCKNARVCAIWTSQNNGRMNRNDPTPRPKRKAWPTGRLIQAEAFSASDKGPTRIGRNNTMKPKSDQHTVPPGARELKPVFIAPAIAARLKAVMVNGKVLDISSERQPFADGRSRYYFSKMYGYQYALKALKESGSAIVKLQANGKTISTVNPGFRD